MRLRLAGILGAGLLACTDSEPAAAIEVATSAPAAPRPVVPVSPPAALAPTRPALAGGIEAGQRVLIRDGVRLYAAPDAAAPSAELRLAPRPDAPADGLARTAALEVVGVRGEFVEVGTNETGVQVREECAPPVDGLYVFSLRAFVRKAELVPVLVRPVQVDLSGETSVRLDPGVGAWPRIGGESAIDARGVALTLELPADALGLAYTAARATGFPHQFDVVDPAAVLTVGRTAVGGRAWFHGRRPTAGAAYSPIVLGKRAVDGGWIVDLRNRCCDVKAFTDRPPIFANDPKGPAGNQALTSPELGYGSNNGLTDAVGGLARTVTAYQVEAGAPFTTLGTVAGKVRHATVFTTAPTAVGRTLCFAPEFGGAVQPELRFCFARAAVKPLAPIRVTHRVEGQVSESMVVRMIEGRARVPFVCDDRARKQRPDLAGRATLRLDIASEGGTSAISVDTSELPGGAVFGACLAKSARKWLKLRPSDGQPARVFFDLVIDRRDALPPK